jgi:hypothetical protein
MSATITWKIEWMQCKPVEGTFTDVVVTAGWRCNGVQDTHNTSIYSTASFTLDPESTTYIPYADLTQEQVLEWVWANGVNQKTTEAAIQSQINSLINPPVVQLPLPWTPTSPI